MSHSDKDLTHRLGVSEVDCYFRTTPHANILLNCGLSSPKLILRAAIKTSVQKPFDE